MTAAFGGISVVLQLGRGPAPAVVAAAAVGFSGSLADLSPECVFGGGAAVAFAAWMVQRALVRYRYALARAS